MIQMRSLLGRRRVLQLFINITRWLHSVHTLSLLPPPPPARLLQPFYRSSPYSGEHPVRCYSSAPTTGNLEEYSSEVLIDSKVGYVFAGNSSAEQHGQVQLMFHFRSVEKAFLVPGGHIQELLNVYGLLHKLRLPGAIHCASLEVSICSNKSACKICLMPCNLLQLLCSC